ncbi:MAG: hypothetical protein EAZ81_13560, partial [Verrucomicrobia bacterium]
MIWPFLVESKRQSALAIFFNFATSEGRDKPYFALRATKGILRFLHGDSWHAIRSFCKKRRMAERVGLTLLR